MKPMVWFYLYIAIGSVLIVQSCARSWKYRPLKDLEDWVTAAGAVFLWPVILAVELWAIWRRRRSS